MLSVLIATYNYNIISLLKELHTQLVKEKILFEIIAIDDASKSVLNDENNIINYFENCSFTSLKKNRGRSGTRNLLAKKANYNWLLFLDGDVMPTNKKFIKNYLSLTNLENSVFCGGVAYEDTKENKRFLHYKHGKKNEEVSTIERNKKPYKYFFTSNFLIKKEVFKEVQFEEKLTKYGREDMLFALDLQKRGYKIQHVSNEIYHLGIENDVVFVNKTKQAMHNLMYLENQNLINSNEASLLNLIKKFKNLGLVNLIGGFTNYFEKQTLKKQSLFFLNCLKVSYLCKLSFKKL